MTPKLPSLNRDPLGLRCVNDAMTKLAPVPERPLVGRHERDLSNLVADAECW